MYSNIPIPVALLLCILGALSGCTASDSDARAQAPAVPVNSPSAATNACSSELSSARWDASAHPRVLLDHALIEGFELSKEEHDHASSTFVWKRTVQIDGMPIELRLVSVYRDGLPDLLVDEHFDVEGKPNQTLFDPIDVGGKRLAYSRKHASRSIATHVGYYFAPVHADGRRQLAVFQLQWDEPGNLACLEASRSLGDALVRTIRLVPR